MEKNLLKIFKILMIVLMITFCFSNVVLAAGATTGSGEVVTPDQIVAADVDVSGITNFGKQIVAILQTVGTVVAVVILIILGIRYMMGSAEEKADYKKTMIPYVIGAILIFAASTIANIVYNFVSNFNK